MHATRSPRVGRTAEAVTWIDERHAIVAHDEPGRGLSTVEIRRHDRPEGRFLADVVHEIGASDRVTVVGPAAVRLALERAYVSINHRPERLVGDAAAARRSGPPIPAGPDRLAA